MHALAGGAVTVFGGERFFATQLVLHGAAVAFSFPLDIEVALIVDSVRRAVLPLILFTMRGRTSLILVGLIAVASLVSVLVFDHFAEAGRGAETAGCKAEA